MPRMGSQERRTEQRREQREALRERILEVSREIVKREGFASLSMRKLAEAIDYSPAALYLHFKSRGDIARALRVEGHASLRDAFLAHTSIADPAARLNAMGRAYVEFGLAEPETYRLMFMEHTDSAQAVAEAQRKGDDHATEQGAATLSLIADAFAELRAADRLPAHAAPLACAEGLWANLHGIVALKLTGAALPETPATTLVELSLDAWFAPANRTEPRFISANRPDTSTR
ncbi:TetR/AcrR family transcriptional regulator [Caballeronia sp. LZ008]|uniref:TetR/AcrR family transcriptional regulator n=2 Tax=Caballeronia TaxID=1827195 RepID=UPI00202821DF|nr:MULTISPECIES: TetR/AcrR family transcriptional regulator [unclassified Caballeronia]MDR5764993.1 TetR/AcrR family transcriptional regulator [Caballeronia sp. LZ028]MDR5792916.1 TetR/AcrR family transcriptional regulator [Caballeronia sp. LZ008]